MGNFLELTTENEVAKKKVDVRAGRTRFWLVPLSTAVEMTTYVHSGAAARAVLHMRTVFRFRVAP